MNPNFELRMRMRKIIRPNLQTLLVMTLIAALPGLLVTVLTTLTGNDLSSYLYALGADAVNDEAYMEALRSFLMERGPVAYLLALAQSLLTFALSLGLFNAILTLLRGGTVVVTTVFSRLRILGRAVLLNLYIALKTLLWELPGIALIVLGMFFDADTFLILLLVGLLAIVTLVVMAYYRYSMSAVVLADEPETGVFACVRQSKSIMKNRKMQLFTLEFPYVAGSLLLSSIVAQLLGSVIGTTLSLLVQLIFNVYIFSAKSIFYETFSGSGHRGPQPSESDPYHDEMKDILN